MCATSCMAIVQKKHEELGFFEGWGTIVEQLAAVVEALSAVAAGR